ncbi:PD-(D/E)XK nuclease family protein [bacterium]|nr:PD-(D/E)XK nuclease family protein [bacterium]
MSEKKNTALSASRIKLLQTCSYQYYCRYILKLPDTTNAGALRGSICHAIFECLGNPRHKKLYDEVIKAKDTYACKPIKRLIDYYVKKHGIDEFEHTDMINSMIVNGLEYDFFSKKHGKSTKEISEERFDVSVDENGKNYRILGFIDKLFLFKKKKIALIRDFKSSKQVFSGNDITDNMQDLMYRLAIKHLYPEYVKREMEFLFLKFDPETEGLIEMPDVPDEELEGFEYFLTHIQEVINNFDEKTALSGLAYHKGFPKKEEGFAGKIVCGRSTRLGQLKKDGTPMWACPFKFARDYYVVLDKENKTVFTSWSKSDAKEKCENGLTLEKRHYAGCPAFENLNNPKKSVDSNDFML